MPNYLITSPDGKKFKVTAPEGATQDQVLAYAKSHWGSLGGAEPSPPPAPTPGVLSSIGAGAGKGFGESMLGAQQLVGKVLAAPTLQAPQSLNTLISGQPPGEATTGVAGFLNKISDIQNVPANWLQQNAAAGLAKLQQQGAPYQAAHPIAAGAGDIVGQAVAALAPEGLLAKAPKGAKLLKPAATWLGRAGQAARTGLVSGAEQPISGPDYWKQKAEETALNVAGSVAGSQLFEGLGGIGRFMAKYKPEAAEHEAVKKIASTIAKDEKHGNSSAKDVIDLMNTSHAAGVPFTLMEAGGANIQGLAGHVARSPGASRSIIKGSFKDRIAGATTRLAASIKKNFDAPDTRREVHEALTASQRESSAPAYKKAFKPGSIAPLKTQFEKSFNEVSRARKEAQKLLNQAKQAVTSAAAKVSRAGNDVYSNSAALRELRDAHANAEDAHAKIQSLDQEHGNIVTLLKSAQQAEINGERGGVWSPHISRMLKNPRLQEGIRRGMRIQQDEADAQNIPFDPTEYAVKYDAKGEPIIFKTPNMRLLDAGKRGIDSMLEDYRDSVTGRLNLNEEGRAIDQLRRAWINELDRINPDYEYARAAYAGPAASKAAMIQGQKIMQTHPEDVEHIFNHMTPAEKEHYRIGAAQAYMDEISDLGLKANELRKISEEDEMLSARKRLQPIFKTKNQLDDFLSSVTGERAIFNARQSIIGNSASAERMVEDATHNAQPYLDAAKTVGHVATNNPIGAIQSFLRFSSHLDLAKKERVREEIARILSDPNIKLSDVPGEVLPASEAPPPGGFTSAAMKSSPIGAALGARAGGSFESDISGQ